MRRAFGSILEAGDDLAPDYFIYLKFLDAYDRWDAVDPRLAKHYAVLSQSLDAFAHDVLSMSILTHEILGWLDKMHRGEEHGAEVATVSVLTEAFILTARTACDAVALLLGDVIPLKKGQGNNKSLRGLIQWAKDNTARIDVRAVPLVTADFDWFYRIRALRDRLIHDGCSCNIHTDGRQFNLWLYSNKSGWLTREPLFPLLAKIYQDVVAFAELAADVIYAIIKLPDDRRRSRVLSGNRIPALKRLITISPDYSVPCQ